MFIAVILCTTTSKESACGIICMLRQQTSPKRWFGNVNMTSYCDVTNRASRHCNATPGCGLAFFQLILDLAFKSKYAWLNPYNYVLISKILQCYIWSGKNVISRFNFVMSHNSSTVHCAFLLTIFFRICFETCDIIYFKTTALRNLTQMYPTLKSPEGDVHQSQPVVSKELRPRINLDKKSSIHMHISICCEWEWWEGMKLRLTI